MSGTPRQRVSVSLTLDEIRATQDAIKYYIGDRVVPGVIPSALCSVRDRLRRAAQIVVDLEGGE